MKSLKRILGSSVTAFVVALLAGALPAVAVDDAIYSMPSRVMDEGLTVNEHIAYQAQIAMDLLTDLPGPARLREVRVALADDEIAAIDNGDRSSTPLKIGLVKPIAGVEIAGLAASAVAREPRRGALGLATRTQDGDFVWAASVQAERAGAIRLHLEDVNIPDGAELYVYTREGEAYGPYTGQGPDGSGEFWVTTVFGPEAILQVRINGRDTESLGEVSFKVTEIGVITEKYAGGVLAPTAGFCGNAGCIVDATCYSAANSIEDAYAKMEWPSGPYLYTCTGGLLNDSNPSSSNFFLTANHCFSSSKTAKNVTFYWRFRTTSCNGSCPSNTGWPYKTTGASVAASNRKGDFTLVQLSAGPPADSVYLAWTNAAVANTNGVLLHRVSNPKFGPQVYNEQKVDTSAGVCRGWPRGERIYSRDTLGGTDGGSSGSPVVNASDQVVGQLSGACGTNVNDPCDHAKNATVDGALAYYFATVKPFLAP